MRRQGYSLIEVLVALAVLGLGAFGAVAAQSVVLRTRADTRLAADALALAQSLAGQMQAQAAASGAAGLAPYLGYEFNGATGSAPAQACFGAACDPAAMAGAELAAVASVLSTGFPGGRLRICRDDAAAGQHWECGGGSGAVPVIKIGWAGRGESADRPRLALAVPGSGA